MVAPTFQARHHPSILVPRRSTGIAKPFNYDIGLGLSPSKDSTKESTFTDCDRSVLSGYYSNRVKIDVAEAAGSRLYCQAVELAHKLKARRERESRYKIPPDMFPLSRNAGGQTHTSYEEWMPKEKVTSLIGNLCSERLYSCSKKQQELGKKRREEIALASLRKNRPLRKDFGVISPDRAANQYLKGMKQLQSKEAYLRGLRARDLAQIRKNQQFSLAEGAFARYEDI